MNSVPAGIQRLRCLVYLDDVVIYAPNLESHSRRLQEIFKRLASHN